ncbi:glycosyltransferase family A protein [Methylobacterium sp. 17Sr1-1]|uniref:glycosyltransferase family A protein n=1 Tax=Methylobacterium sp. 17Sr1-1 TaxID=2202826 RepID=UPI000D6FD5AB|nr:glycosyltransferase family A protein [Methylobacterium sp. 17Sr1-1]AWN55637.1 hypothetical protein DK412_14790 [Methylobacterium sp. 17Sr1-1]
MTSEATENNIKICIVVPIYRHVSLAIEALLSALDQEPEDFIHVVAIVDGDADLHLARGLQTLQFVHRNRCSIFWKKNAGLSAARNTGIEIALSKFARLESIYFLDADNHLGPNSLANASKKISRNEADIIYPNLNNFGLRGSQDTAGKFSLTALLRGNYIEAGSLVSVKVFQSGLRFNEILKHGYEDWDFWLRAAHAGFRFFHDKTLDLRYRKRPESMLAETNRRKSTVLAEIMSSNRDLFSLQCRRRFNAQDEPRFAIFNLDQDFVEISDDLVTSVERLSIGDCASRFHAHQARPNWIHFPEFLCFSTKAVLDDMRSVRIINGAIWSIISELQFGVCGISHSSQASIRVVSTKCNDESCHLVVISRKYFADILYEYRGVILPDQQEIYQIGRRALNSGDTPYESVSNYLRLMLERWRMLDISELRLVPWSWRTPIASRLPVEDAREFPRFDDGCRHIGFIFDADSQSREKLLRLAHCFHDLGWTLHLLSVDQEIDLTSDDIFSTINFIRPSRTDECEIRDVPIDSIYFGAELGGGSGTYRGRATMDGFSWLDAVVVLDLEHIPCLNGSAVNRPSIIVMLNHDLSLAESFKLGKPYKKDSDLAYKISAYEHILTVVWCANPASSVLISALSVPRVKIAFGYDQISLMKIVERVTFAGKERIQVGAEIPHH